MISDGPRRVNHSTRRGRVESTSMAYFPNAACAAASLAIGTRNGEQLT
jgi:hypothetical protein